MSPLYRLSSVLLVASLAGCSSLPSVNPMNWFGSAGTEKPAALTEFKPRVSVKTGWQAKVGAAQGYAFAPAFTDKRIFATGHDGQLHQFNAATGASIGQSSVGSKLSAGVAAGDDIEVVGTLKGQLLAFDGSGKALWKIQLSSEVLGVPQVVSGIVIARTADGHIYALDAKDGSQKWMYERSLPALSLRSQAGLLVTRGGVFAGFAGGKLVALALDNGTLGWEANVAVPKGASEIERIADITSTPVADGSQVCATAYQGRVACFDLRSGNLLWSRDISSTAGLAIDDNNVYVTDTRDAVIALEKTSGRSVWKQDTLRARHLTAPARVGNYLAVGDLQGYVHLLALDDGSFAGRAATDGSPIISTPQAHNGGLLVQTANGGVYALTLQP